MSQPTAPFAALIAALTAALSPAPHAAEPTSQGPLSDQPGGPPGLVPIPGGRTRLGIDPGELERMVQQDETLRAFAGALSAETPAHEVEVAPFLLMPTEVTGLQYAHYLRATGARAPLPWCEREVRAASEQHGRRMAARAAEARENGLEPPAPEEFDAEAWWRANGAGAAWELPPDQAAEPVAYVSFDEAEAYARWAGLRLPSEAELVRAVRGDTRRRWTWGDDTHAADRAATAEGSRRGRPARVGSFPTGASRQGIHDLAGNVWEWTASAFTAFPGYEAREWTVGFGDARERVTAIAPFDATQRVIAGGSFQNPLALCRASVRMGLAPGQRTDALGFRCAASPRPGEDLARAAIEGELARALRPQLGGPLPAFAPARALALASWTSAPVEVQGWTPPAGFVCIAEHRALVFAPIERVAARDPQGFAKLAAESGPIVLGFVHANVPLVAPDLPAGTYVLAWRPARKGTNALEGTDPFAREPERDLVVLCDPTGAARAAIPATLEWAQEREGSVERTTPATDALVRARFGSWIASETSRRGWVLTFELGAAAGAAGAVWR